MTFDVIPFHLSQCRRDRVRHAFGIRVLTMNRFDAWKMRRFNEVVFLCLHLKFESLKHELLDEGLDLVGIIAAERLV